MTDLRLSQTTAAGALTGSELAYVVQSGNSRRTTVGAIANLAPGTNLSYDQATRLLSSSTGTDVTLPLFSPTLAGLVAASGGGTTTFLRADGTWASPPGGGGTVTSVSLSAPTGFSVSGSPVTSTGTLALSFAAGYSLPTDTRQADWDAAFTQRRTWDGGSQHLNAATGRASLELGSLATQSGTFSGTSSGSNTGDVTLAASVADVLSLVGQELQADDPGGDRLLFLDHSEGKLRHLELGSNLSISGTTLNAAGGGGGISDGDKGDITVSASGTAWTIDAGAVSYAKIQDVSATDRILGRSSAGAGDVEEIVCTAAGRALLDDANAAAQLITLGAEQAGAAAAAQAAAVQRSNHTGTQLAATISDFGAAVTALGNAVWNSIRSLVNPSAVSFLRINADNSVTARSASEMRGDLGLTSAATATIGTAAGNLVALDGSARLPAVDGSQLTGLPAAFNPAIPGPIGGTTPAAGTFTALVATTRLGLPSGAPASPAARDLYQVADTLRYRDSGGVERLLLNGADNLANLGNTATARSNLGLGSAATAASSDFVSATATRAANLVFAGPTSGAAAAPTFRALVAADLPAVVYSQHSTITASGSPSTYTLDAAAFNEFSASAAVAGNVTITASNLASVPSGQVWRAVFRFAYTSGAITLAAPAGATVKGSLGTLTAGQTYDLVVRFIGGGTVLDYRLGGGFAT